MKICFLIGTNDVGGAEFVSYHHVMMAYRNGLDVLVLSGTTGKFYNLMKDAGVRVEVVGMQPDEKVLERLMADREVVFNCNFMGAVPMTIKIRARNTEQGAGSMERENAKAKAKSGEQVRKMQVASATPRNDGISKTDTGCRATLAMTEGVASATLAMTEGFRHLVILHNDTTWLCKEVLKYDQHIDGYYAIHQKIVDSIVAMGPIDAKKFTVIPNCVDVASITSAGSLVATRAGVRKEFGFTDHHFVIGMITRIAGDKNILDAVRILNRLPDGMNARLMIIGGPSAIHASGVYYNKLLKVIQADRRLRDRVIITGNKEMVDVYRLQTAFDIGLNCSPSEGLPIAMLEMMAIGTTCVMPSIGDITEVLTGRGIVVPIRQRLLASEIFREPCYSEKEVLLFVNAIKTIYAHKFVSNELGRAAKQFISDCRSLNYQEKEFLKFLEMGKKKVLGAGSMEHGAGSKEQQRQGSALSVQSRNDKLPKVSVLMPTRDGNEEWMTEAIDSILNQRYAGEMEFVIVNHDCRLSMTEKINNMIEAGCRATLAMTDGLTRFNFKHELITDSSVVFSEALDYGVSKCTGEIIVRMDHDDIADPELISKVVDYLLLHPEVDICGVQIRFFGAKEMVTHHPELVTRQLAAKMPNWWFVNHPGIAMRKSALLEVGGYGHTPQGLAEDYHLWCKFLKSGRNIVNLQEPLVKYRCYKKDRIRPEGYMEDLEREKMALR